MNNMIPDENGQMQPVLVAGDMNRGRNLHLRTETVDGQVQHTWVIID